MGMAWHGNNWNRVSWVSLGMSGRMLRDGLADVICSVIKRFTANHLQQLAVYHHIMNYDASCYRRHAERHSRWSRSFFFFFFYVFVVFDTYF